MISREKARILLVSLCALLAIMTVAFATLAYLQHASNTLTNTFTVGAVNITLTENVITPYGESSVGEWDATSSNRTASLVMLPGTTYAKQPTVTVEGDSEACMLYVKVVDPFTSLEAAPYVSDQIITTNGWTQLVNDGNTTVYYKAVSASASDQAFPVFNSFTTQTTGAAVSAGSITVQAYAVQQVGFAGDTTAEKAANIYADVISGATDWPTYSVSPS